MYANSIALSNFPEWYKVEKETENTIKKLFTVRDLTFYIKNSDEYIRRLAILRLSELKLKESIDTLRDILENPSESCRNKELAAWTIKAVSIKWNVDLYISNKFLSRFTGNELYCDIYNVEITDTLPSMKFNFTSSLMGSELRFTEDNYAHSQDINLDTSFCFKEWFELVSRNLYSAEKKMFLKLPMILLIAIKNSLLLVLTFIYKNILLKSVRVLCFPFTKVYNDHKYKKRMQKEYGIYYTKSFSERLNPIPLIKKAVFNFFYVLFFPIRLILKHKKLAVVSLVAIYFLLAFTVPGKTIANKYLSLDLVKAQTKVYSTAKVIIGDAWNEINEFAGINNKETKNVEESIIQYRVTARTGLNLRKAPSETSGKVLDQILEYNSTVTYLSISQQDLNGRVWFMVKTPAGKTGWVSSKWLERIGGNGNAGR